jgi:hypothetical protein
MYGHFDSSIGMQRSPFPLGHHARDGVGLSQPSRPWAFTGGRVAWVEEGAFAEGQTTASDTTVKRGLQRLKLSDSLSDGRRPRLAHSAPFALRWRAICGKVRQSISNRLKSQPHTLARSHDREPSEGMAGKLAFVARRS